MLGHNNGPPIGDIADTPDVGRRYYWKVARKAAWRTPPVEIVRLRERAAARIGLTYNDFTSILLDRGRRPSAVIFTLRSLVRVRRGEPALDGNGDPAMMPGVDAKLGRLGDCSLYITVERTETRSKASGDVIERLERRMGRNVAGFCAGSSAGEIVVMLNRHGVPGGQAIMVGDTGEDESCARAAGVAQFFWAWHYFGAPLHTA